MSARRDVDTKVELHKLEDRWLHLHETILILLDQIAIIDHEMVLCKTTLSREMQ